jgi:hypothetical protein
MRMLRPFPCEKGSAAPRVSNDCEYLSIAFGRGPVQDREVLPGVPQDVRQHRARPHVLCRVPRRVQHREAWKALNISSTLWPDDGP